MKYGHFDDEHREYVIDTPRTPLPWINYLGSEDFFTLVSNTAGGYSFYKDARLRRLTRYRYNASPLDQDGFHVYLNPCVPEIRRRSLEYCLAAGTDRVGNLFLPPRARLFCV